MRPHAHRSKLHRFSNIDWCLTLVDEKLVRDRIPEIIRNNGETPEVRVASIDEMDFLLRRKIVEESNELLASGSDEEVADVLEALYALLDIRGLALADIERLRQAKRDRRGGFSRRFVLRMKR